MMDLREFIDAYKDGSIENDITWRGNDIPASVRKRDLRDALKWLGYQYAGELGISVINSGYQVGSMELTRQLIEYWWCHHRASSGACVRMKRRSQVSHT